MSPTPDETWPTHALFERAVADAGSLGPEEHGYWDTVYLLQKRDPDEVWSLVAPLALDDEPALRSLVPDVLRFLGGRDRPRHADTLELLREMLRVPQPPRVLVSIATAFVDLADESAIALLGPLTTHSEPDVRLAAVHGLLPVARLVVPELIALSRDPTESIRDWATFGLGSQTDVDSPEVREALAARLEDDHGDTRAEAALGLALRSDPRALPIVQRELESETVGALWIEAATALAHESLFPALQKLAADDPEVERALIACRPGAR